MASRQNMDIAINNVLPIFGVQKLKDEQKQIVESILNKKDCIAVLPTGYGKSLPFQMYLLMKRELQKLDGSGDCEEKVLVCSPLVSLMQDQVQRLSVITEMKTAYKGDTLEMDQKIKDGEVDLIYASPETLDGDPGWRSSLQKLNVTLIVVDEFHTIATWGTQSDDKMEAFRKWFPHIGELRSLFPHAVLLALSATCTLKIRKIATKSLNLYDATEITESPNKTNIKISVFKVPTSI